MLSPESLDALPGLVRRDSLALNAVEVPEKRREPSPPLEKLLCRAVDKALPVERALSWRDSTDRSMAERAVNVTSVRSGDMLRACRLRLCRACARARRPARRCAASDVSDR